VQGIFSSYSSSEQLLNSASTHSDDMMILDPKTSLDEGVVQGRMNEVVVPQGWTSGHGDDQSFLHQTVRLDSREATQDDILIEFCNITSASPSYNRASVMYFF
jgi:hypothetical protein